MARRRGHDSRFRARLAFRTAVLLAPAAAGPVTGEAPRRAEPPHGRPDATRGWGAGVIVLRSPPTYEFPGTVPGKSYLEDRLGSGKASRCSRSRPSASPGCG